MNFLESPARGANQTERFSPSYKLHSPVAAFILLFFIVLFQNEIIVQDSEMYRTHSLLYLHNEGRTAIP